jgi:hypothetical protein
LGPYAWKGRILEKDSAHVGPGHHSILRIPGRDQWYIVYHRYNGPQVLPGMPRTTHIDTLRFNADGSIAKVAMTDKGVRGVDLAKVVGTIAPRGKEPAAKAVSADRWPGEMRLSARNAGLIVQAGAGAGRLRLYDSRGLIRIDRGFRSGETCAFPLPGPGRYWALWRSKGRNYRKSLQLP